jgi:hypothetical protein
MSWPKKHAGQWLWTNSQLRSKSVTRGSWLIVFKTQDQFFSLRFALFHFNFFAF